MEENINERNIWETLDRLEISIREDKIVNSNDKVFVQYLKEGIQEKNLDEIYKFIYAMENGCGVMPNPKIYKLVQDAYIDSSKKFCDFLVRKDSLFEYWYYLSCYCSAEMIGDFVSRNFDNAVFYYECARQLMIKSESKETYADAISNAVKKFTKIDLDLWKRWLTKNESKAKWQEILGKVLGDLSEEALVTYAQNINLDMSVRADKQGTIIKAYAGIPAEKQTYVFDIICKIIYDRWNILIEQKKKNNKKQNEILITAYTNVILFSMNYVIKNTKSWKACLSEWADTLEQDMYAWYPTISKMETFFLLDCTQIYYLLLIGKNNNWCIKDADIAIDIDDFFINIQNKGKNALRKIIEYIRRETK